VVDSPKKNDLQSPRKVEIPKQDEVKKDQSPAKKVEATR